MVKFVILGPPKGKARPRVTKSGHAFTPKETSVYENLVRIEYRRQCNDFMFPPDAYLDVRIIAYYGIPKSASNKRKAMMRAHQIRPTLKPDWDNVGKIICDSLNQIAYKDDSQIVDAQVRKFYDDNPMVVVTIREAQCQTF